jgi:hypothetical protein
MKSSFHLQGSIGFQQETPSREAFTLPIPTQKHIKTNQTIQNTKFALRPTAIPSCGINFLRCSSLYHDKCGIKTATQTEATQYFCVHSEQVAVIVCASLRLGKADSQKPGNLEN